LCICIALNDTFLRIAAHHCSSVVLTIPRHLNFHRFDQIKVALDKILRTFIVSVEIKVTHYQIGGNLGGVEQ
jgi:hypothetical protein